VGQVTSTCNQSRDDDYNIRLLTDQELNFFTNCTTYVPTTPGNLINEDTRWNISGSLIKKVDLSKDDVFCSPRTIYVHIKYKKKEQAMDVCEELGETGGFINITNHFPV
jgi:hypothetical protein